MKQPDPVKAAWAAVIQQSEAMADDHLRTLLRSFPGDLSALSNQMLRARLNGKNSLE